MSGICRAVILCCSDKRLPNDIDRFAVGRGWNEDYAKVAVPGDCDRITIPFNPAGRFVVEDLLFMAANTHSEHVVVVAHENCVWRKLYGRITAGETTESQKAICLKQLKIAGDEICLGLKLREIRGVQVELVWASEKPDNHDDFDFHIVEVIPASK